MNAKKPYPCYNTANPLLVLENPFLGKQFYCWDATFLENKGCCFNHMIGLPKKDLNVKPLFPYEKTVYDAWHDKCIYGVERQLVLAYTNSF